MKCYCGWKDANNNDLFIYRSRSGWGVTFLIKDAYIFQSEEQAVEFYLGVHAFPDEYIEFIINGTIYLIDLNGNYLQPVLLMELSNA